MQMQMQQQSISITIDIIMKIDRQQNLHIFGQENFTFVHNHCTERRDTTTPTFHIYGHISPPINLSLLANCKSHYKIQLDGSTLDESK